MIDYSDLEKLIEECLNEISSASRDRYDSDKADRTAALFLQASMKLSFLIEEIEMKAKQSKNEIVRIEGNKYFECKSSDGFGDKKITENFIAGYIAKDQEVVAAKRECAEQEAALKKWGYIMNTLNSGHIYFRNISKNKSWSE